MKKSLLVLFGVSALMLVVAFGFSAYAADDEQSEEEYYESDEDYDVVPDEMMVDIMSTLAADESLSRFVALLEQAGLDTMLADEGMYTVFAPFNDAFASVPDSVLKSIKADSKMLRDMLMHHILVDTAMVFDELETQTVVPMSGDKLRITADYDRVTVDGAVVVEEEIWCANGVIHVIDKALLPKKEKK